jgi:hypothetical protein
LEGVTTAVQNDLYVSNIIANISKFEKYIIISKLTSPLPPRMRGGVWGGVVLIFDMISKIIYIIQ